jgi:tetratricopeptide (TPR) repeat protein
MSTEFVSFGAGRISRTQWLEDYLKDPRDITERAKCIEARSRQMLSRALNLRTTVLFAGSGLTVARYVGWTDLVKEMFKKADECQDTYLQCIKELFNAQKPEDTRHYLWVLERIQHLPDGFKRQSPVTTFRNTLRAIFSEPKNKNPLEALEKCLELPVHRFATTNYDKEIETELSNKCAIEQPEDLGFTQCEKHAAQQAEFSVANRNLDRMRVFHLHGRCDDAGSLIATESDYRRFYMDPSQKSADLFRHSVQVLLTSNPILFVGFGLNDPDFMRTLEFLRAVDEPFGEERAVFAVIPTFELETAVFPQSARNQANPLLPALDYYWQRYGIHILPYACEKPSIPADYENQAKRLTERIADIYTHYCTWRSQWQQKPKFLEPRPVITETTGGPTRRLIHPRFRVPTPNCEIGKTAIQEDMCGFAECLDIEVKEQLIAIGAMDETHGDGSPTNETSEGGSGGPGGSASGEKKIGSPSVIVLLGPGGCGKSHRALKLATPFESSINSLPKKKALGEFTHYFFWSTYYADDWLTGIDALLNFLDAPAAGSRFERLKAALKKPALIVFDGFERVLVESIPSSQSTQEESSQCPQTKVPEEAHRKVTEVGAAYSTGVREFLRIIGSRRESGSTVVLTSRLWPQELGVLYEDRTDSPGTGKAAAVGKCTVRDELGNTVDELRALRILPLTADCIQGDFLNANQICALLSGHAYSLRLAKWLLQERKCKEAKFDPAAELGWVPLDGRTGRAIDLCIVHLSGKWREGVQKLPADSSVLRLLERLAIFMSPISKTVLNVCQEKAEVEAEFKSEPLLKSPLVQELTDGTYTLHPVVRGHIFHRLHGSKSQEMPNFTLAGLTTGTAAVDPGTIRGRKAVCELFDALYHHARNLVKQVPRNDPKWAEAASYCRAAFSIMRARMDATAAARWDKYKNYIERSVRLFDVVKQITARWDSSNVWDFAESGAATLYSENGVLHAEELAWLVNDIGLACACEGDMYAALAVWNYGYEINRVIEHDEPGGQFTVQSQLHLGHAYIELGELDKAREYLLLTERTNQILHSKDYEARISGYMGVVEHLSGDAHAAADRYDRALRSLETKRNRRAASIFSRHRADLFILTGEPEEAWQFGLRALGMAQAENHPDLAAFVHNTLGHIHRANEKFDAARIEYNMALGEARRIGIRRLESDVQSELARLSLDQKEPAMARSHAMRSLRIANECGLGLRQCHALVVLGLAVEMEGHRELAVGYLRAARRLCDKSSYWLRKQEVDRKLHAWGVDLADEDEFGLKIKPS